MFPASTIRPFPARAVVRHLSRATCVLAVAACLGGVPDAFAQATSRAPLSAAAAARAKKLKRKGPLPLMAFPGSLVWQTQLSASPVLAPAFVGARAYVALPDNTLAAVDLDSGQVIWTVPQAATVAPVAGGDMVAGAAGAVVWVRDAETGTIRWQQTLTADSRTAPLLFDGTLVVALASGDLVGLKATDGTESWRTALGAPAATPLARFGTLALVGLADSRVRAAETSSGKIAWTQVLSGPLLTLSVVESRAFAGAGDNFLYVLDARNGRLRWQWRTGGDPVGVATADTVGIYHLSLDNTLRAHHRRTGDLLWKRDVPSRASGGPVSVGDRVVVGGVAKELRAFGSGDGTPAGLVGLPGRVLHRPYLIPDTDDKPGRLIVMVGGGLVLAIGDTIEPPIVPLRELPGKPLRTEAATRVIGG